MTHLVCERIFRLFFSLQNKLLVFNRKLCDGWQSGGASSLGWEIMFLFVIKVHLPACIPSGRPRGRHRVVVSMRPPQIQVRPQLFGDGSKGGRGHPNCQPIPRKLSVLHHSELPGRKFQLKCCKLEVGHQMRVPLYK